MLLNRNTLPETKVWDC